MSSPGNESAQAWVANYLETPTPSAKDVLAHSESLDLSHIIVWAVLPELAMRLAYPQEAPPGSTWPVWGRMRNVGRALERARGPALTRVGPALFLSQSVQTDRVLRPCIDALAPALGRPERYRLPRLGPAEAVASQRVARRAHRNLSSWLRETGIPEPVGIEEELAKAEIMFRRGAAADFRDDGIGVLVTASQHNSPIRAVIAAAGGAPDGPASCYIPHAPVADSPFYRDLPVHYALLRGPAEVDLYRCWGVDDFERVHVVGQPGLPRPPGKVAESAAHVLYAASGHADRVLRADIEVILRGVERPVEVCLHPRMSLSDARELFPDEWTVHPPGKTLDVLHARGAFALIQHGSGVGLEALSAGVDVIDLCPAGERPNYPYLARPHVQLVSNEIELESAIDAVPSRRVGQEERIRHAQSWCSAFDPEASAATAAAIRAMAAKSRPGKVLLDGWGARPGIR